MTEPCEGCGKPSDEYIEIGGGGTAAVCTECAIYNAASMSAAEAPNQHPQTGD